MDKTAEVLADAARLKALRQAALLDTPPEEAFDRLTRLAARILGVPVSLVSLVDKDRQFFKSCTGIPEALALSRQTPLTHSFCQHAVLSGEPVIVEDAREHPVLKDNPAVALGVVAYAGIPLVTPDGLVLGSFCAIDTKPREWTQEQIDLLRDLTAAAMTEIELRRVADELRRSNEAKDRFFAMLSHELRTPLSPALLAATAVATDAELPERLREDVQLIQRNIELEVRLIDSLLDLTRITNGKLRLHSQALDAHDLLAASVAMCGAEASAKPAVVRLDLRAARHALRGDSAKLQQVVCNLLKNAIKFSSTHGEIVVRSLDEGAGSLKIEISDKGSGIAPDVLPHVFNLFEQGGKAVTQRFGGLGLGLAICKGIVEAHGGSISAVSEGTGRGTTMTVVLPGASLPQLPKAAPRAPAELRPPLSLKILLVEDHEDSLRAMSRLLRKLEHQVTTATCVSTALEAAALEEFDLLISDVGLPDGTGLELMKELLTRRPIKGIALTGYGMESDIQQTHEAGFQRHLTKPINFIDLQEIIQEMA
ncbi:MAG: domain S-box [Phycisphaerales bacterium]|nr:domain S-box [Phycisphaerales bacterium]